MKNSNIEWTDHTFNAWTGCNAISPGCDGCYAAAWAKRAGRDFAVRQRTKTWGDPVRWNKQHDEFFAVHGRRQRVFTNSLADVFDNQAPTEWRMELFSLIADTPNLDWLILTKRIGNVMPMCSGDSLMFDMITSRVWLGATVVNQEEAARDIPKLLAVPAHLHFISYEPALGGMWIAKYLKPGCERHGALDADGKCEVCEGRGIWSLGEQLAEHEKAKTRPGLSWVIAGGESGPRARPTHPDWFRSLRDQCAAAGVPFLFKQWGEWVPYEHSAQPPFLWSQHGHEIDGHALPDFESQDGQAQREWHCDWAEQILARRVGKKAAGRLLDGVEHNGCPT